MSDTQLLIRFALLGAFCAGVLATLVAITYAMDEQERLFVSAQPKPLEPVNADSERETGRT